MHNLMVERFYQSRMEGGMMVEQNDQSSAQEAAQQLLQKSLTAGEAAYPAAKYNIAYAYILLGKVMRECKAIESATILSLKQNKRLTVLRVVLTSLDSLKLRIAAL